MNETTANGSDERQFLHDMASPLGTVIFVADSLLEIMQSGPNADPEAIFQIKEMCEALEKLKNILSDRREVLIKRGIPSAV
jgi:hypothetical protein